MAKWASSSGVGPIPGDSGPSPSDMIIDAEQQAILDRLALNSETTRHLSKDEIPRDTVPGIALKLSTKITKAQP
jgi:hypothetical protein